MSISAEAILKTAQLAKLKVNDHQQQQLEHELNQILTMVDQLKQANTHNVTPLAHPLEQTQPTRADQVNESNQREAFQSIAPNVEQGLYIVPQVIESE